jgi:hypothetical protein
MLDLSGKISNQMLEDIKLLSRIGTINNHE